jgi:hypothetical protein
MSLKFTALTVLAFAATPALAASGSPAKGGREMVSCIVQYQAGNLADVKSQTAESAADTCRGSIDRYVAASHGLVRATVKRDDRVAIASGVLERYGR